MVVSWNYSDRTVNNGDVFGVMFKDGDGNLTKLQTTGGVDIDTTFTVSGMDIDTWKGTFAFASDNYTVAAKTDNVPEPTSGILLLVGGALLALRRKRS